MTYRKNAELDWYQPLGANVAKVRHGDVTVLFSRTTPIAVFADGVWYVTATPGRTVTRHINQHTAEPRAMVSQTTVEHMAASGEGRKANPPDEHDVVFDEGDAGVYIDGARGIDHAMRVMRYLLRDVVDAREVRKATDLLQEDVEDDFQQEWLDDATEVLQSVTASGLVWWWEVGDLILLPESGIE